MIGGNVAQGFSICSNNYVCFSTAPSGLYQAIQRACRCQSHHMVISTNIRMNRLSTGLKDIEKSMLEDEAQQYIGDVQIADPWDLFPWTLTTNELQIKIGLTGTRQL